MGWLKSRGQVNKAPQIGSRAAVIQWEGPVSCQIGNAMNINNKIINSSQFILGDYVNKFEKEFAAAHGAKYCLGCGNGTDAIYITLRALGISAGDEVITTALSFFAISTVKLSN